MSSKHDFTKNPIKYITDLGTNNFLTHNNSITSIAFHPTKDLILTGSTDTTAILWQINPLILSNIVNKECEENTSSNPISFLKKHNDFICCVVFHPTAPILATSSYDKSINIFCYDFERTYYRIKLEGHTNIIWCIAFHPTADPPILASCSCDKTIKLWKINSDYTEAFCVTTLEEKCSVDCVTFHPNLPILVSSDSNCTIKIWQLNTVNTGANCTTILEGHKKPISSIKFHPNANIFASSSGDKTIKIWKLTDDYLSANCIATLYGHTNVIWSIAFHPTAEPAILASGSEDKTVKLWIFNAENTCAECLTTLEEFPGIVYSVAFHSIKPILATSCEGEKNVRLWEVKN